MSLAMVTEPGCCRLTGVLLDDPVCALEEVVPNSHAARMTSTQLRRPDERQRSDAVRSPNDTGDYESMLWAGDGTGANGEDTFRIKIWTEDNGTETVVYDNGVD